MRILAVIEILRAADSIAQWSCMGNQVVGSAGSEVYSVLVVVPSVEYTTRSLTPPSVPLWVLVSLTILVAEVFRKALLMSVSVTPELNETLCGERYP